MTEQQQHHMRDSVRIVIEGLAVLALAWTATTVTQQNVSIARLQTTVTNLQVALADVPRMTRDLAQIQVQVGEHERRITRLEDGSDKAKRWTR